ncbi:MAG: cyclophilin-like family protein [Erysipelotrichaceae bacterium]
MKLKLSFHNQTFQANLLEKEAPIMIQELKNACPFDAYLAYAKICDNEIFFQAPISKYEIENPVYSIKGHISYYAPKQTICIWYGDTPSLGDCDLFAILDESQIELFRKEADKIWNHAGDKIKVELIEEFI